MPHDDDGTVFKPFGPGLLVATSRFWSTLTTAIPGPAGSVLLVDPGVYPDELDGLAAALAARNLTVEVGFATHAHWDHVLWHRQWRSALRFVTAGTAWLLAHHRAALIDEPLAAQGAVWDDEPLAGGVALSGTLAWSGPEVIVVQTDAHVPGHGSLHLAELGVLCAGDLVSDVDVPFPFWGPPDGLAEGLAPYRLGLDRLAGLEPVHWVLPGHGRPTDGRGFRARLDADRRYLEALDAAVAASATVEEALERSEAIDDRLAEPAVAAAHERSVRELFREWSTS